MRLIFVWKAEPSPAGSPESKPLALAVDCRKSSMDSLRALLNCSTPFCSPREKSSWAATWKGDTHVGLCLATSIVHAHTCVLEVVVVKFRTCPHSSAHGCLCAHVLKEEGPTMISCITSCFPQHWPDSHGFTVIGHMHS